MKRIFEDKDLNYLNGRIDRLYKKLRKIEDLLFTWGNKYMELEEDLGEKEK